jgi:hypothetical protein
MKWCSKVKIIQVVISGGKVLSANTNRQIASKWKKRVHIYIWKISSNILLCLIHEFISKRNIEKSPQADTRKKYWSVLFSMPSTQCFAVDYLISDFAPCLQQFAWLLLLLLPITSLQHFSLLHTESLWWRGSMVVTVTYGTILAARSGLVFNHLIAR